jgi:hypothetical protein
LPAADEAVADAVGDVAELGDVDVDQRPGMVVLVAAKISSMNGTNPAHNS